MDTSTEAVKKRAEDEYRKRLLILAHGKAFGKDKQYGWFYNVTENKLDTIAFVLGYDFDKIINDIDKAVKELKNE